MRTSSIIIPAFAAIGCAQTFPKDSTIGSESSNLSPNQASIYPGDDYCTAYYFLPSFPSFIPKAASEWAALSTALAIPVLGYFGFPHLAIFAAPAFAQAQMDEAVPKQSRTAPGSCHAHGGRNSTVRGNLTTTPMLLDELSIQDKKGRAGSGASTGRTAPTAPRAASGATSLVDLTTLTIALTAALIGTANVPTLLLLSATALIVLPSLASAQPDPTPAAQPSVTHVVAYDIFGHPFITVYNPHATDMFLQWHPSTPSSETGLEFHGHPHTLPPTSESTASSTPAGIPTQSSEPLSNDAAVSMSEELAVIAIFAVLGWIVVDLLWEWIFGVAPMGE